MTFNMSTLDSIVTAYWCDFNKKKNFPFVVKNSLPIIWFGDIESYFSSKTRILTVSINPSAAEFPKNESRFGNINSICDNAFLISALNNYFNDNPYRRWFNNYDCILKKALDSSYYHNKNECHTNQLIHNQSIHIDIYSAIATNPTWGRLTDSQKRDIMNTNLFKDLFDFLNPDIVLYSANRTVRFEIFGGWQLCQRISLSNNAYIEFLRHGSQLMISGLNCRGTPFGGASKQSYVDVIKSYI